MREDIKQATINVRQMAVAVALQLHAQNSSSASTATPTAREDEKMVKMVKIVEDAKLVEEYVLAGIEDPPMRTIVPAKTMPGH